MLFENLFFSRRFSIFFLLKLILGLEEAKQKIVFHHFVGICEICW